MREPYGASQLVPTLETRERAAPWMRSILDAFPLPNRAAAGDGLAGFVANHSTPSGMAAWAVRIDQAVTSSVLLFARFSDSPSTLTQRGPVSVIAGSINNHGRIHAHATSVTAGAIQTLGGSATHEIRGSFARAGAAMEGFIDELGGAAPPDLAALLPAGVGLERGRIVVLTPGLLPALTVGNITSVRQRQWNVVDTVTLARGTHELKAGVDFRQLLPFYDARATGPSRSLTGWKPVGCWAVAALTQVDVYEPILAAAHGSAFVQDIGEPPGLC